MFGHGDKQKIKTLQQFINAVLKALCLTALFVRNISTTQLAVFPQNPLLILV
jgi:hypothetical protein